MGQDFFFHSDQVHLRKLQTFRRMQGHQRHHGAILLLILLTFQYADQRHVSDDFRQRLSVGTVGRDFADPVEQIRDILLASFACRLGF